MADELSQYEMDRFKQLKNLARSRFSTQLQRGEELALLHSSTYRELVAYPNSMAKLPIRPEFLRWLLTDCDAADAIDPWGYRIWGATIAGNLDLQGIRVGHPIHFMQCQFDGTVTLFNGDLRTLFIFGSTFNGGLRADSLTVRGPFAVVNTDFFGEVRIMGAKIARNLEFNSTRISKADPALLMDGARIEGSLFLREGFTCAGEIRMLNAEIAGDFGCTNAVLTAPNRALSMDKLIVRGGVALSLGFQCDGAVIFQGGQIHGDFDCKSAVLNKTDVALNVCSSEIRGHLYLRHGFQCAGSILMQGTKIGHSIDCTGATITAPQRAISLEEATVGGTVFLCDFTATGRVEMSQADIMGNLVCDSCRLLALYSPNAHIHGSLEWTGIKDPDRTSLWLNHATVRGLHDERESWPSPGNLHIDGLRYDDLMIHPQKSDKDRADNSHAIKHPIVVKDRLDWLNLQPEYELRERQPWAQFASVLKERNDDVGAKRVIFAYHQAQSRRLAWHRRYTKLLYPKLQQNPFWILLSIAVSTAFAGLIFWMGSVNGALAPTNVDAYKAWATGSQYRQAYPAFQPFVYALENDLPLVKLGQNDQWVPDRNHRAKHWFDSYGFLYGTKTCLILFGWVQASILATALASRFKN
jgi:hypothetical protein